MTAGYSEIASPSASSVAARSAYSEAHLLRARRRLVRGFALGAADEAVVDDQRAQHVADQQRQQDREENLGAQAHGFGCAVFIVSHHASR